MKLIAKEFYRAHRSIPLRFLTVSAICVAVLFLTGTYTRENTRLLAIVVSAFLGFITLWSLIDVMIAPKLFERQLGRLPENVGGEIRSGFENASKLGKRWFMENYLVYFAKRRIRFLRFDELRNADIKGNKLFVSLADSTTALLPFEQSENPAILVAALRSKNGQMKASVNGKPVDFDKKRKK